MAKYDFNLLHDDDFQRLGCHVVCLRENFEIESFSKYKDKGIDGLYQNKNTKIVIQCKRYKNFNSLFSNLKNKELDKVKKISPSRYILVLATKINKEQKTKILKLFKDYIIDDKDIITGDDLEYYFTENKYEEAKNEYLSYLSPSYSEYKKMLDLNINKAIYKDTEWLINDILKYSKYFVATQSFNKAKKALNESKIILLTGDPGSGKTTNAVMLIDYLYKNKKIKEFYKVNSCKDIMSLLDENISQAFFIDDFWGSTNVFQKFNPEEENKLLYIIEHLESANNTYLILTTREYILQQKMNNFKNLKSLVTDKRIFFKNNKYTKIEKINILLKHAASSNLDLDYIAKLTYNADYIVSLPNYSPRFVSSYLDKITDIKKDSMTFVKDFIDYLDHPYDYFSNIFNDFSLGAKMILYLLGLVSSLEYEDLKYSFIKVAKKLDNINPSEFDDYLHELESSWIDINVRDNKVFFTNYTYEEYTLEILKNKIIDFIDVLIEELPIFNFIFNIINMNIQLDDRIKDKVIERIIKEYDYWKVLDDYNYAFWARKDLNQGDIIWQLIRIAKEYKSFKLLNFIKDKVILNIENYKFNIFNVEDDDLGSVPELLKKLEELGIDLDMEDLIIKYISKAVTMNQIYALRYLPLKYQPYIKNYLKNIFTQDNIIEKLCCDLWLLSYDGFTMKYEMLLDDFPDILKYLGLKLTKEIKTIINDNKLDHHDNNYKFDNKPNKENNWVNK